MVQKSSMENAYFRTFAHNLIEQKNNKFNLKVSLKYNPPESLETLALIPKLQFQPTPHPLSQIRQHALQQTFCLYFNFDSGIRFSSRYPLITL